MMRMIREIRAGGGGERERERGETEDAEMNFSKGTTKGELKQFHSQ